MLKRVHLTFLALCLVFASAGLAWAEGGTGEVAGFGGLFWVRDSQKKHPNLGGSIGANLGRFVNLFGEVGYMPFEKIQTSTLTGSAKLMNYGGGLQIRIPVPRVEPYGLLTFGYGQYTEKITRGSSTTSESLGNGYAGLGAGARIFVGKRWGFKPEFRYQNYYGIDLENTESPVTERFGVFSFTGGIFFQFGGDK